MPRIRSVHPGIFTDEAFMTASAYARLLIIGLWCEAHDDGVFEWKPLTLKVRLMPADAVDLAGLLDELLRLNFVKRFHAKGKWFGVIRNFQKYQRPKKPNRSGVLPDELISYTRGDGNGSDEVPDEYGTGGEPVPPGEEDGGGRGEEDEGGGSAGALAREPAALASALPDRRGTDEIGSWLRSLVGTEPVIQDLRTQPVEELLVEGLTRADVEVGIAAAMADPSFRPRSWKSLVGWIRRAARDRLESAPKARPALGKPASRPGPTPEMIRRQQIHLAQEHFRGHWSDAWPNQCRPEHPDCTTPEELIQEAKLLLELEKLPDPNIGQRLGFTH